MPPRFSIEASAETVASQHTAEATEAEATAVGLEAAAAAPLPPPPDAAEAEAAGASPLLAEVTETASANRDVESDAATKAMLAS